MPTREDLHKLVDSLPEGAIEAAQQILTRLQVWPPTPPSPPRRHLEVQAMRERMQQGMEDRRQAIERGKQGSISGFGAGAGYDRDRGAAYSSSSHWEGDTHVTETVRLHQGHELVVIQRTRVDGPRLI